MFFLIKGAFVSFFAKKVKVVTFAFYVKRVLIRKQFWAARIHARYGEAT
jgi:hypothetical protein